MTDPAASGAGPVPELEPEQAARAFEGPAPAFLDEPDLLQRLNLIRHLIQSTRMTVLVTGPEGVGKSACLDQLQRGAEPRWLLCRIAGATTTDPERALARLARCCDLPPDCGRPALRQLLAEHATVVNRGARLPVIAVDDAHGLEPAALQELVALTSPEAGWRLLLLAEPGHDDHWATAGLTSAAQLHSLEWPPLSEPQTGAYVLHRLRGAGWTAAQPLSPEQIRKLHRDSTGVPGTINRLAPALLARQRPAPRPAPVARAGGGKTVRGAALALVAVVVGLVLWQQDRVNELFQPPEQPAPAPAPLPKQETTARAPAPEPAPELPPAVPPGPEPGPASSPEPVPEPIPESAPAPLAEAPPPPAPEPPPQQSTAPATAPAGDQPAQQPAAQQTQELDPALTAPRNGADSQPPAPAAEPQLPGTAVAPAAEPAPDPDSEAEVAAAPEPSEPRPAATAAVEQEQPAPVADQPAQSATTVPEADQPPAERDTPAEPAAGPPSAPAVASGAGWVLAQEPTHYTLQLLGSRERKAVTDIIERYNLGADTAWYKIQYRGGDWYVLVHGAYPDSRVASAALTRLPPELRRAGPWPRPLSAVQDEVRRGRK